MSATVVTIRNREGHAMHCILEEPAGGAAGAQVAAVLLSPGVKTRVGPHRLNRKLARPFLERGIPVVRVDFHGLGDSEGTWADDSLEHIYRQVERGECTGDARAALDCLESRFGIRRFIVGGLCGAAMTGLHLAHEDRRVCALFAVGLPARLDATGAPVATRGELQSHWSRYLLKVASPAAWMRLVSLKSDYRLMWRALKARLRKPRSGAQAPNVTPPPDLNPHLPESMFALLETGGTALLLYGEQDPRRWEFDEKFLEPWATALAQYRAQIRYSVIPAANHILGTPAAVAEAQRQTGAWLDALLGRNQVPAPAEHSSSAMLHSAQGSGAIEIHRPALECVVEPIRATSQDLRLCSTNEYSSSTRLPK